MRGAVNVKSIIVLVIILLVGVLSVLAINTVKTYMSSAATDTAPKEVLAKPLTDGKSAVISWTSEKASMGVVEYGTTPASLLLRAVETESVADHKVTLAPLKAGANYYFRIRVGEEIFDNNGIPYSFKTLAIGDGAMDQKKETAVPTSTKTGASENNCVIGGLYNGKTISNSLDLIECLRAQPRTSVTPVPTSTGCRIGDIFNGKEISNSLDKIECLKSKNK